MTSCLTATIIALFTPAAPQERKVESGRPARLCATDIRERVLAVQQEIRSIRVEYRTYDYPDEESRAVGAYLHRLVAAKAPASLLHLSAHGTRDVDWPDDPDAQRAIITSERAINSYDLNRVYIEEEWPAARLLPGTLPTELFFHATGVYPLTGRPAPLRREDNKSPSVLRDVAASSAFSYVRPQQEMVNGRYCHVLENPGVEALWIDVDHGCALLARELYDVDTGDLMSRYECGAHREVAPGIWLPMWMRAVQFDFRARFASERTRRLSDSTYRVISIAANDAPDRLFTFRPPPGAVRLHPDTALYQQTAPGGLEHMQVLARWAQDVLASRWIADSTSTARNAMQRFGSIALGAALMMSLRLCAAAFARACRPNGIGAARRCCHRVIAHHSSILRATSVERDESRLR